MCFRTIFYSQKFPVNRQNTAWKKSSNSTVLRNTSGGPKFFLVIVEASNSHHVSCTYSNWRKWVQFGPTHCMAIFTVLRNTSGGPKFFLVIVEASNSHHVSCTYSNWRKWVQFGPTPNSHHVSFTYSNWQNGCCMAIFGRCEKFTSVRAIFVKTVLCTLRHPETTWYHSKA